jgi:hypothetical protein
MLNNRQQTGIKTDTVGEDGVEGADTRCRPPGREEVPGTKSSSQLESFLERSSSNIENTEAFTAVQCSAVQCSAVQCSAVHELHCRDPDTWWGH